MIDYEQNKKYIDFANRILSADFNATPSVTISNVDENGEILAVVIYTRFSKHNCEMSIATSGHKNWASKRFLKACYAYVFYQCGLKRITVVVDENNNQSITMCKKLGHVKEGILHSWFGETNGVIFRMKKEECKWL